MGNSEKKRTKLKFDKRFFVFLFLAIIYIVYWYYETNQPEPEYDTPIIIETETSEPVIITDGVLYVHMINCGQGDCFLFEQEGKYALIDCGTRTSTDEVIEYLNNEHVTELEFIVGTHPHDDHMGGMQKVLQNFECQTVYMPKFSDGLVTTNWYMGLMQLIDKENIEVINPSVNDVFYLGDAVFRVVGQLTPEEAGNNINNYSTVIEVSFGEMDLLCTGDAETKVEKAILDSGVNIDCEILKLGHHGSDTSTSEAFLQAVSPEYGLISCGVANKYEHPCTTTVEKLKAYDVELYRTDELGDVVLTITSDSVTFSSAPGDYLDGVSVAKQRGE